MSSSFRYVIAIAFFLEILFYHLTSALFYHFSENYSDFNWLGLDIHIALKLFQIVSMSITFFGLCGTNFLTRLILPLCNERFIGGSYRGISIGEKSTAERKNALFDNGSILSFQISQSVFKTSIEVRSYKKSEEDRSKYLQGKFLSNLSGVLFDTNGKNEYYFGTTLSCDSNLEYGMLRINFDFENKRMMGRYTSNSDSVSPSAYDISADL
jgi:hypothetical protein